MVARLGWERHAERLIRRAVTLRPDLSVGYARMANLARGAGRLDEARVAAEIAAEMDPSAVESWLTLASVCEAQGSSHEADRALAKTIASDETLAWPRIRMARRFAVAGRWAEARAAAEGALAADKASPLSWHALAAALWGAGDAEGAFRALLAGIERSSDDQLVPEAARLVAVAWRGEDATRRIDELLAMTAGSPNAVADITRMLQVHGHDAAALRVLESAVEASSGALSASWWLLQGLLRVREPSDAQRLRTTTLAASLFAQASHFPPLVVLRACQLLDSDPVEALAFIEKLDATIAPAALWELAARALDHLGRADDATQLRRRIARTLPDGAVDAAALLAPIGRHDLARDLLVRAEEAAPGRPAVLAWLAASLCALGDPSAATDRYLACSSLRPEDLPVVPAMRAARDASRWDVVEAMARRAFENVETNSCIMDDPWEAAGARAGAMLARGDESGRDELLARAGHHPDALEALVRIEKKISSPHFDRDLTLLLRVAPGTRVTNHEEHAS